MQRRYGLPWIPLAVLSLLLAPALAETAPTVTSTTAPTVAAICPSEFKSVVMVREPSLAFYSCLDEDLDGTYRWSNQAMAAAAGGVAQSLQYNSGGSLAGLAAAKIYCGHIDVDVTGDGTADLRTMWDWDCDGTQELLDVQAAACDLQGVAITSDGTENETYCRTASTRTDRVTLMLAPGVYTGGFRDQITITQDYFTLIGSGRETTVLQTDSQACADGTANDPLDDGDGTIDHRALFDLRADGFTMQNLAIDGQATFGSFAMTSGRDRNDCDNDGTDDSADTTPDATLNDCTHWCTRDRWSMVQFNWGDGVARTTVDNVRMTHSGGFGVNAVESDGVHVCQQLTITNSHFDDIGFDTIVADCERVRIENNYIGGNGGGAGILFSGLQPEARVGPSASIVGNLIENFRFAGIQRECNGYGAALGKTSNVVIAGNTIVNTNATPAMDEVHDSGIAGVYACSDAAYINEWNERWLIADNVIQLDGFPFGYGILTLSNGEPTERSTDFVISGNLVKYAPPTTKALDEDAGVSRYGIYNSVVWASVSDNIIDLTPDGSYGADRGIASAGAGSVVSDNVVVVRGAGQTGTIGVDVTGGDAKLKGLWAMNVSSSDVTGVNIANGADRVTASDIDCYGTGTDDECVVSGSGSGLSLSDIDCYNIATCVVANGPSTFVKGVRKNGGGGANAISTPNSDVVIADVACIGAGCDGSAGGISSGVTLASAGGHGWSFISDGLLTDGDGTIDSTTYLRLHAKTKLAFEGATANQYLNLFTFPDPSSADNEYTFPSSGGTLTTEAGAATLTAKTVDIDDNALMRMEYVYLPAAVCDSDSTAETLFNLPSSNAPAKGCIGTNIRKGTLDFDATTDETAYFNFRLPNDWDDTQAVTFAADLDWTADSTATTNLDVFWVMDGICVDDGEAGDPTYDATVSLKLDGYGGTTAFRLQHVSISPLTVEGCLAGDTVLFKIYRDADHAGDTLAADARLLGVGIRYRRNE